MNYKKYKVMKNIKDKVSDITVKTLRFLLYPVIILAKWYDNSDIRNKIECRKTDKKIRKKLYHSISRWGCIYLTDQFLYEDTKDGYDIFSTNYEWHIPFNLFGNYSKKKPTEVLQYYLSVFEKDKDVTIEKMTVKDVLGERYYMAREREREICVYKISLKSR